MVVDAGRYGHSARTLASPFLTSSSLHDSRASVQYMPRFTKEQIVTRHDSDTKEGKLQRRLESGVRSRRSRRLGIMGARLSSLPGLRKKFGKILRLFQPLMQLTRLLRQPKTASAQKLMGCLKQVYDRRGKMESQAAAEVVTTHLYDCFKDVAAEYRNDGAIRRLVEVIEKKIEQLSDETGLATTATDGAYIGYLDYIATRLAEEPRFNPVAGGGSGALRERLVPGPSRASSPSASPLHVPPQTPAPASRAASPQRQDAATSPSPVPIPVEESPVATPVSTPVATPAVTPVEESPAVTPVATPVADELAASRRRPKSAPVQFHSRPPSVTDDAPVVRPVARHSAGTSPVRVEGTPRSTPVTSPVEESPTASPVPLRRAETATSPVHFPTDSAPEQCHRGVGTSPLGDAASGATASRRPPGAVNPLILYSNRDHYHRAPYVAGLRRTRSASELEMRTMFLKGRDGKIRERTEFRDGRDGRDIFRSNDEEVAYWYKRFKEAQRAFYALEDELAVLEGSLAEVERERDRVKRALKEATDRVGHLEGELEDLTGCNAQLLHDIEELRAEIRLKNDEIKIKAGRVGEVESELAETQRALAAQKRDRSALESDYDELSFQLNEAGRELSALRARMASLDSDSDSEDDSDSRILRERNALRGNVRQLEVALAEAYAQVKAIRTERDAAEDGLRAKQRDVNDLEVERDYLKRLNARLQEKHVELEASHAKALEALRGKMAKLKDAHAAEVHHLEEELAALRSVKSGKKGLSPEQKEQMQKLEDALADATRRHARLNEDYARLEEESADRVQAMEERLAVAEANHSKQATENNELQRKLGKVQDALAHTLEDEAGARDKLQRLRNNSVSKTKVERLIQERVEEELHALRAAYKEKMAALEGGSESADAMLAPRRDAIHEAALAALTAEHEAALANSEAKIQALEASLRDEGEQHVEALKKARIKAKAEQRELQDQLEILEGELRKARVYGPDGNVLSASKATKDISDLTEALARAEEELRRRDAELRTVQSDLDTAEDEISESEGKLEIALRKERAAEAEAERLQLVIDETEAQLEEAKATIKSGLGEEERVEFQDQVHSLEQRLREARAESEEKAAERHTLEAKVQERQKALRTARETEAKLKAQVQAKVDEIERLKTDQLKALRDQRSELEARHADALSSQEKRHRSALVELSARNESVVAELQAQAREEMARALAAQKAEFEEREYELNEELQSIRRDLGVKEREMSRLSEDLEEAASTRDSLEESLRAAEEDGRAADADLETHRIEAEAELKKAADRFEQLKAKHDELDTELARLRGKQESLISDKAEAASRAETAEEKGRRLAEQVARLEASLERQAAEAAANLADVLARTQEVKASVLRLEEENQTLLQDLISADQRFRDIKAELERHATSARDEIEGELEALQVVQKLQEQQLQSKDAQLSVLKQRDDERDGELAHLKSRRAELTSALAALREEYSARERDITRLEKRLAEYDGFDLDAVNATLREIAVARDELVKELKKNKRALERAEERAAVLDKANDELMRRNVGLEGLLPAARAEVKRIYGKGVPALPDALAPSALSPVSEGDGGVAPADAAAKKKKKKKRKNVKDAVDGAADDEAAAATKKKRKEKDRDTMEGAAATKKKKKRDVPPSSTASVVRDDDAELHFMDWATHSGALDEGAVVEDDGAAPADAAAKKKKKKLIKAEDGTAAAVVPSDEGASATKKKKKGKEAAGASAGTATVKDTDAAAKLKKVERVLLKVNAEREQYVRELALAKEADAEKAAALAELSADRDAMLRRFEALGAAAEERDRELVELRGIRKKFIDLLNQERNEEARSVLAALDIDSNEFDDSAHGPNEFSLDTQGGAQRGEEDTASIAASVTSQFRQRRTPGSVMSSIARETGSGISSVVRGAGSRLSSAARGASSRLSSAVQQRFRLGNATDDVIPDDVPMMQISDIAPPQSDAFSQLTDDYVLLKSQLIEAEQEKVRALEEAEQLREEIIEMQILIDNLRGSATPVAMSQDPTVVSATATVDEHEQLMDLLADEFSDGDDDNDQSAMPGKADLVQSDSDLAAKRQLRISELQLPKTPVTRRHWSTDRSPGRGETSPGTATGMGMFTVDPSDNSPMGQTAKQLQQFSSSLATRRRSVVAGAGDDTDFRPVQRSLFTEDSSDTAATSAHSSPASDRKFDDSFRAIRDSVQPMGPAQVRARIFSSAESDSRSPVDNEVLRVERPTFLTDDDDVFVEEGDTGKARSGSALGAHLVAGLPRPESRISQRLGSTSSQALDESVAERNEQQRMAALSAKGDSPERKTADEAPQGSRLGRMFRNVRLHLPGRHTAVRPGSSLSNGSGGRHSSLGPSESTVDLRMAGVTSKLGGDGLGWMSENPVAVPRTAGDHSLTLGNRAFSLRSLRDFQDADEHPVTSMSRLSLERTMSRLSLGIQDSDDTKSEFADGTAADDSPPQAALRTASFRRAVSSRGQRQLPAVPVPVQSADAPHPFSPDASYLFSPHDTTARSKQLLKQSSKGAINFTALMMEADESAV